MPRTARASVGGVCYHAINRGNAGLQVFDDVTDYESFVELLGRACDRLHMRILAYCLMPSHFHLMLRPFGNRDLGRWMQWLLTSHVRRHHRRHGTNGHVWGGRFKAFPIQRDEHLLTVLRYVERNPLRANLVRRAEDWRWSSLKSRRDGGALISEIPQAYRPRDWIRYVNQPQTSAELEALRRSVARGAPFGSREWSMRTAKRLGLEQSLRPRGRPRKGAKK